MEMSDVSAAQAAAVSQNHDIALTKKSNDMEKQEAAQIINALPKVDHSAPAGGQVNMLA
jgi:hypothetical protein